MSSAVNEDKDIQDEEAILCICGSDIDDNATIQCDSCNRWQHMRCVGIDPNVVDIETLVYHCNLCHPRPLDRDAAIAYIESYKREEAQTNQPRARRGRGKGSGRRGGGASSPLSRQEARRQRGPKTNDSDEIDEVNNQSMTSGQRDYTWLQDYVTTDSAAEWMQKHVRDYPACPPGLEMPILATVVKPIPDAQGSVRGLFTERDAPSNAFVGRYLGVIGTRHDYEADTVNHFESIHGPLPYVAFVQQSSLVIDARKSGCETRFIRKSCTPNCTLIPLVVDQAASNRGYAWEFLVALKDNIQRGDEITIGHQWGTDDAADLDEMKTPERLAQFATTVTNLVGECACSQPAERCRVRKWFRSQADLPQSRKCSPSREASENAAEADSKTPPISLNEVPMTREERKIQMAIARMENADAPKVKRRRRDTSDDNTRPNQSRRASSHKDEESESLPQVRHAASPPVSPMAKTTKTQRGVIKSRAKLIRSPSPDYNISSLVPRKLLWLRMYSEEKAASEEQRLRVAEQAREATARLAKETTRKKQELEQQAREAKEAKEREAEASKRQAEREAKEALQRAREREIWGDHPTTGPTSAPVMTENEHSEETAVATTTPNIQRSSQASPAPKPESPGPMGPPLLPREQSQASPPAVVAPKIVRKLSVSEYLRQKKEREASEASPSPSTETFSKDRDMNGTSKLPAVEDDKSDGEIEAGEVEVKREAYHAHQNGSPTTLRNDYVQPPPAAPKAVANSHHTPPAHGLSPGPSVHPSRAYPGSGGPQHQGYFPPYARQSFAPPDSRNNRPPNGYNNAYPQQNNNNLPPSDNYQRPPPNVPTGPKSSRSGSGGGSETNPSSF